MGILAPLFLAGLTALSLPLIFHLVRRTPRGRQLFSSLMFLSPTPPQLTRRSRLDQILLLLLRLSALAILVFAFCRPFLREAATLSFADLPSRRVAILLDVSASMRRDDLWPQALRKVEEVLGDLNPHDEVALFTFGDRLKTIVDFEKDPGDATGSRADLVRQSLRTVQPTWEGTDLGASLVSVAAEIDAATDVRQSAAEPQIVLIGDFQKGARIEALQSFDWPDRVRVVAHVLSPKSKTNAFAQRLVDEGDSPSADPRVRVVNAADSTSDQFVISWDLKKVRDPGKPGMQAQHVVLPVSVYVPPGQSRVVKLPRQDDTLLSDQISLSGDDHTFDNAFHVVPPRKKTVQLAYIGSDAADDAQGLQYYLRLALGHDPLRQVELQVLDQEQPAALLDQQLLVVTEAVTPELHSALVQAIDRGATLLLAPKDDATAPLLPAFLDDVEIRESPALPEGKYLLLGEIDFTHPLFLPFANPKYSDFTKIHFWRHRAVALKEPKRSRVVAKFDNGDPAILERTAGKGRVIVFTSSWQPDDSQLALSSKFVPLMGDLLDLACGGTTETLASATVLSSIPLPAAASGMSLVVQKPDGTKVTQASGAQAFTDTDQPGVYHAVAGADDFRFAVNLSAAESNTAPLNLEQLEQFGVRLGDAPQRSERLDRVRQQRDVELESRQKVWRWLIIAALGVLALETWLAGRWSIPAKQAVTA